MGRRARWIPDAERATRYLATRDIPCPRCGYVMRGLESARCPECGREVDAASMIAQATRLRDEEAGSYRALRVVVVAAAAVIAAVAAGFLLWG